MKAVLFVLNVDILVGLDPVVDTEAGYANRDTTLRVAKRGRKTGQVKHRGEKGVNAIGGALALVTSYTTGVPVESQVAASESALPLPKYTVPE